MIIGIELTAIIGLVFGWYFGWITGLATALISAIIGFCLPSIIAEGLLGKSFIPASDAVLVRQPQVNGIRGVFLKFASPQLTMLTCLIEPFLRERGDFWRAIKVAKIGCIMASQVDDWQLVEEMIRLG